MLGALALLAGGCGGESPSVEIGDPGKAPDELAELHRTTRELDAGSLAEDALEPEVLANLLEEAGFAVGREVEYTGRTKTFNHVVARTLLFEDADGAKAYLTWLEANASDLLGPVKSRKPFALGTDGTLFLEEGCNCHANLPTFLAGWRDGEAVRTLLADGAGANEQRVATLARALG